MGIDWNAYVDTKKSGYLEDLTGLSPMQKSNLILQDFAPGGALPPKSATQFLVQAVLSRKMLTMVKSGVYDTPSFNIPSSQFGGQILYAGTEGQAVPAAQRSKPVFTQQTLTFKLFKGQVRIDDGVFETNVERSGLNNTIMSQLDTGIGKDMENAMINADTTITNNSLLNQFDGLLKQQTSWVVAGSGAKLDKNTLKVLWKRLPIQYRQDKASMGFFTATDAQTDYIDSLGNRVGEAADKMVTEGNATPKWGGIAVNDIPLYPVAQGNTADRTSVSLLDPKNLNIGFNREVKIEHWRDYDAGQTVVNVSVKFDVKLAFEAATAKYTDVLISLT